MTQKEMDRRNELYLVTGAEQRESARQQSLRETRLVMYQMTCGRGPLAPLAGIG